MQEYKYKAINLQGKVIKGTLFCNSKNELIVELKSKKYFLIKYSTLKYIFINRNRKVTNKELYIFSKQMAYMMDSGFNICESLNILCDKFQKTMRKNIKLIEKEVENGNSLHKSMELCGDEIPHFFKNMIYIGEESGNLSGVFRNLADYYRSEWKIKEKIKNASTYPIVVFIFTIIVLMFLVSKVIPKFVDTLNSLGGKLPEITQIIMNISLFMRQNFPIIFIFIGLQYFILKKILKTKKVRIKVDRFKFKIPFIRKIYMNKITLRFSNVIFILLKSGIDIVKAMYIASEVLDNLYAEECVMKIVEGLKNGKSFRKGFENSDIFTKGAKSMFIMAEECGNMEEIMSNICELYSEEFKDDLKRIINLVEPCMIILLAIFVGTIIISSILPMINIMNSI
ncbi:MULTISPECIES: type II secretion system F family protein [Clostridium]|uniref:type II secretion system F family protein n=1 Tax=Clostridium TaxID=1485 RepID=UPI00082543A1|nr:MULTISPECIES: type II secretion system F family protein [Clostridium]PJI09918.1 type II secretion system F family protein [Clostridium sp. CT7]